MLAYLINCTIFFTCQLSSKRAKLRCSFFPADSNTETFTTEESQETNSTEQPHSESSQGECLFSVHFFCHENQFIPKYCSAL
jgi:hypothetical protein